MRQGYKSTRKISTIDKNIIQEEKREIVVKKINFFRQFTVECVRT